MKKCVNCILTVPVFFATHCSDEAMCGKKCLKWLVLRKPSYEFRISHLNNMVLVSVALQILILRQSAP
jgi:hypothetical protein